MNPLEHPIVYRAWRGLRRNPRSLLSLLFYPAIVFGPSLMVVTMTTGDNHYVSHNALELACITTLLLHSLYFCLRSLLSTQQLMARERERRTLDSLLGTRVGPSNLVLTQLVLALGPRLLELAVFGPFLTLLPDMTFQRVAVLLVLTAVYIIAYGALGLWCSARSSDTMRAQTGLGILAVNFVGVIVLDFLADECLRVRGPTLSVLVSPWMATLATLKDIDSGWSRLVWLGAPLHLGLAALFLGRATAALRRAPAQPGTRRSRAGKMPLWARLAGDNPILFRRFLSPWSPFSLLYLALVAGPPLLSVWGSSGSLRSALAVSLACHLAYFSLRGVQQGASAVAGEIEKGTWESLLTTRLTPMALLRGKLLAVLLPLTLEWFASTAVWVGYLTILPDSVPPAFILQLQGLTLVCMLAATSFSLLLSLHTGRSARAHSASLAVLVFLVAGTTCIDVLAGSLRSGYPHFALSHVNPAMALATCFDSDGAGFYVPCVAFYALLTLITWALMARRLSTAVPGR